jgi:2-polyprenyl-3-methyl-5-hydroxy-6-metoxy-1,4-benzoquinol methylase
MYEKLEECPSCKHTQFNNFNICKDFTVTHESFALVKCSKCQLVFTNPRPTPEVIGKYYKSDSYISHANKTRSITDVAYKLVRSYTLQEKRKHITKHIDTGQILDYGCGTGHFLHNMKSHGWKVQGLEPDIATSQVAADKIKQPVHNSIDTIAESKPLFDIITAWHVIEHVHDLKPTLKALKKMLSESGLMFIALPNHNSYDASYYREHWAAYDVPRHLYHFSQDSFMRLIKNLKLHLIETLPMPFDSYYVSLLSEKYMTGKPNYLNAIRTANKSNKLAKTQSGEYSSLIYVLSK